MGLRDSRSSNRFQEQGRRLLEKDYPVDAYSGVACDECGGKVPSKKKDCQLISGSPNL